MKSFAMLLVSPNTPFSLSRMLPNVINNAHDLVLLAKLYDIETRLVECSLHLGQLLDACKKIDRAAIVLTDVNIWTWSAPPTNFAFRATSNEMIRLVSQFEKLNDVPIRDCRLEGINYSIQRGGKNYIVGKTCRSGVVAMKVGRFVLIACYKDGNDVSVLNSVRKIAATIKQE